MVKKIPLYECEICGSEFRNEDDAIECESKGIIPIHPIGTIFSRYSGDMVFAVIEQYPNSYKHNHTYSTWACRDTNTGDNCGGEEFCGFESWDKIYPPNTTIPAYKRMVEALEKAGIKPINYEAQ